MRISSSLERGRSLLSRFRIPSDMSGFSGNFSQICFLKSIQTRANLNLAAYVIRYSGLELGTEKLLVH